MSLKDKFYDYFVKKNGRVQYEYERYVREHIIEHRLYRYRHLRVLLKLNWFYRVKKSTVPFLYPDTPMEPVSDKKIVPNELKKMPPAHSVINPNGNVFNGSESQKNELPTAYHFARSLLKYDVISFDVFDTLLFRKVSDPKAVFLFVGDRLGVERFYENRIAAERKVRELKEKLTGNREVTLFQIYSYLEKTIGIDPEKGMQTEIEVETELLAANPYMREVLDVLNSQNKEIILVSDMYMPKECVNHILLQNGISEYKKLYISCEFESNKNSKLYKYVLDDYPNLSPERICHVGDNFESDVKAAGKAGLSSLYYPNIHEKGNAFRVCTRAMSGFIGNAYSGIVNSWLLNGSNRFSVLYEYGFLYGGLYVLGYMNWVHQFAINNKIDKVIFLSRDGFIYHKIFNYLFSDVKNEYIYWSRIVTARSAVKNNRRQLINYVLLSRRQDPNWFDEALNNLGIDIILKDITDSEKANLVKDNEKIIFFLNEKWDLIIDALERYNVATDDVVSHVSKDCSKIAIVDVGWQGSGAEQFRYALANKCEIYSLIVGSLSQNDDYSKVLREKQFSYAFSSNTNRILYDLFKKDNNKAAAIFELFTQACCPMFKGYQYDENEKITYEFFEDELNIYNDISEIHKGIFDFCKLWKRNFENYKYMLNISGWEALSPFRVMINDKYYYKSQIEKFSNISLNR